MLLLLLTVQKHMPISSISNMNNNVPIGILTDWHIVLCYIIGKIFFPVEHSVDTDIYVIGRLSDFQQGKPDGQRVLLQE